MTHMDYYLEQARKLEKNQKLEKFLPLIYQNDFKLCYQRARKNTKYKAKEKNGHITNSKFAFMLIEAQYYYCMIKRTRFIKQIVTKKRPFFGANL